ncbi:hypothetical protein B0H13DRAFT_2050007 [Mycena leptocephala]|nr:hypothetical protein B0H13DRAFT_2050007 [Mycena leptocephala]
MDFLLNQPATSNFESQAKSLIAASEANIARIESQIRDLERLRDRERGIIARLRMAIAPIHKLPAELLVEIFLLVRGHPTTLPRYLKKKIRKLHTLSQVCAYWRRVAYTTPHLWTEPLITELDKTPTAAYVACVKEWLERSAPLPIPVDLRLSGTSVEAGPLMDAMVTAAHRWSSATLDLRSLSVLSRIPTDSLKSLERLSLESPDVKHHAKTRVFLTAVRLRRLSLTTPHTPQLLMPWSQLTEIDVTDGSPWECLDTLVQCTSLVSAHFETETWPDLPDLSERQMTTLGRLEDFSVSFSSISGFVAPFFMCLALPALKKLILYLDNDQTWSSADSQMMEPSDLLAVLQHAPSLVRLRMEGSTYCFDGSIVAALQYSDTLATPFAPRLEDLSFSYLGTALEEDALDAMIQSRWWTDEQLLSFPSPPKVSRWASRVRGQNGRVSNARAGYRYLLISCSNIRYFSGAGFFRRNVGWPPYVFDVTKKSSPTSALCYYAVKPS